MITVANIFPWCGEGSPDVKTIDVNFGATPVDWTVGICQTPIEWCTAFVFDPKVGEGENAVAALCWTPRSYAISWWGGWCFASVTFVPACEGGQARAGGTVGVSGTLRAVGGTPEVVGATARGADEPGLEGDWSVEG